MNVETQILHHMNQEVSRKPYVQSVMNNSGGSGINSWTSKLK